MAEEKNNPTPVAPAKRLYRLPDQGKVAGVAAGMAEYFEMDVTLMRVLWIIAIFATGGFFILAYFIMAVVMPVKRTGVPSVKSNDVGQNIDNLVGELEAGEGGRRLRNYFGVALVLFGSWLLIGQFYPGWLAIRWDVVWPLLIIVFGVIMLTRAGVKR